MITASIVGDQLQIRYCAPGIDRSGHAVFIALDTDIRTGSAVVPFGKQWEGSTVFLPFRADRIYSVRNVEGGTRKTMRLWESTRWSAALDAEPELDVSTAAGEVRVSVALNAIARAGKMPRLVIAVYAKAMEENDDWGRMLENAEFGVDAGFGDKTVTRFLPLLPTSAGAADKPRTQSRLGPERVRIYQLLPRLFSNTNETRKPNGSLAENGVGKFAEINDAALGAIREMGFTHVWLTGVLQQATATDHSAIGAPADDPDLLKGLAGSPYAIKDYFDVCPDYATQSERRIAEFQALLQRAHNRGLKVIIDFVPNHVARSYQSDLQPELSFGAHDDRRHFFSPRNNFFYLHPEDAGHGPPLRLPTMLDGKPASPTCAVLGTCDGRFEGELDHGRVTGNNTVSWAPGIHDWYETVKLNYGFDFTIGTREYPHGTQPGKPLPDTWMKMDRILDYWQTMGVDGFRCDMAHMVPPEFWNWAIGRARARQPGVWFMAEAYNDDPMRVRSGDPGLAALGGEHGNVMIDLLSAGFDAVYDHPTYKGLKAIYDGEKWANDLDAELGEDFISQNSLRYAENHDEVRLAARDHWGGIGSAVGRPVSAILYGLSRGPIMLYSGQEVGEPADGAEGFGKDNGRTTIFDYWSMPELAKWVNGHRYDGGKLSPEQQTLRAFYGRLVRLAGEPAFRDGGFFPLNGTNKENDRFGRLPGEGASGHWLYAFLRHDAATGQRFLIVANLHRDQMLRDVHIRLPHEAIAFLQLEPDTSIHLIERLAANGVIEATATQVGEGVGIPEIPPLTPCYFEIHSASPER